MARLSLALLAVALAGALALWLYGVYCYVQMVRHRRPGVSPLEMAWPAERLTPRGLDYRRRALRSYVAFALLALFMMLAGSPLVALWREAGAQQSGDASRPRVVALAGARDRPGLFAERLILPAGYCGPLHTHGRDLHGLVTRGTLLMGLRDSTGRMELREHGVGEFVPVPAGRPHIEGAREETEIHLTGLGPLRTAVLERADAERCR
jgi:hypothetical protein